MFTRPQLAAATMIIEHGLIYYIWTDGLKVAELGNNWNNTRKNGMRIKVRSRGELNGKNNLGFDGNHWPGPTCTLAWVGSKVENFNSPLMTALLYVNI